MPNPKRPDLSGIPRLTEPLENDELTVVGYHDNVKLQCAGQTVVRGHGPRASGLAGPAPRVG